MRVFTKKFESHKEGFELLVLELNFIHLCKVFVLDESDVLEFLANDLGVFNEDLKLGFFQWLFIHLRFPKNTSQNFIMRLYRSALYMTLFHKTCFIVC
jgi:hypothetical protein